MANAPLTYVQKQLGHSSIQITVDLYFHWIKRAERSRTLDVDRLMARPQAVTADPELVVAPAGALG